MQTPKISKVINRFFRPYFLFLVILLNIFPAYLEAQSPINLNDPELEEAIRSISKWSNNGIDKIGQFIQSKGYQPEDVFGSDWRKYPAIRKLEMIYESAELGNKGNGEKLLAILSQHLAQKYDAFKYEKAYEFFQDKSIDLNEPIQLVKPKAFGTIEVPQELRPSIESISKYTGSGALGGPRGILKFYLGISNQETYEILRTSNSPLEAISHGVMKASPPPPIQEKLSKIIGDLYEKYEPARNEKTFNEIVENPYKEGKVSEELPEGKKASFDSKSKTVIKKSSKRIYIDYLKENFPNPAMRSNQKMIKSPKGFGGILLGAEIEIDSSLSKLIRINYLPFDSSLDINGLNIGMLELHFESGEQLVFSPVFEEDVFAAFHIVFDEEINYNPGEGIGIVGVEYSILEPDSIYRGIPLIHPAVEPLRLGWASVYGDFLPGASEEILLKLSAAGYSTKFINKTKQWLEEVEDPWKIVDVPMKISRATPFIEVRSTHTSGLSDIFLSMYTYIETNESNEAKEELDFHNLIPVFSKLFREYERLNEFPKTLALMRWAKQEGAKVLDVPNVIPTVVPPYNIYLLPEGQIANLSVEDDWEMLKKTMDYYQQEMDSLVKAAALELKAINELSKRKGKAIMNHRNKLYPRISEALDKQTNKLKPAEDSIIIENLMEDFRAFLVYSTPENSKTDSKIPESFKIFAEYDSLYALSDSLEIEYFIIRANQEMFMSNLEKKLPEETVQANLKMISRFKELWEKEELNEKENKEFEKIAEKSERLLLKEVPEYSELKKKLEVLVPTLRRLYTLNEEYPAYINWRRIQIKLFLTLLIEKDNALNLLQRVSLN